MNNLKEVVLATLVYGDVFGSALDFSQLYTKLQTAKSVSKPQLKSTLNELVQQRLIIAKDSYYCLYDKSENIKQSRDRSKIFQKKLVYAKQVLKPVFRLPFVEGVFITGSLAVKNSLEDDDIDLLIVTQQHRMWLTRFLITIFYELRGLRKRPHDQVVRDKLCFNMFLETDALKVPAGKQNLYTAYEVVQALPIYQRNALADRFLYENQWILSYLANVKVLGRRWNLQVQQPRVVVLDWVNTCLYRLQIWYMQRKKTSELVRRNQAFFHPRPTNLLVMNAFETGKKRFGLV